MPIHLKEGYLHQIQILRALSVLLIFFFHSNLELFSKGYLGVDIFFYYIWVRNYKNIRGQNIL
jgi:peptidoglycan/LPS O-acetylase OafA/YrhL